MKKPYHCGIAIYYFTKWRMVKCLQQRLPTDSDEHSKRALDTLKICALKHIVWKIATPDVRENLNGEYYREMKADYLVQI